MLIILLLISFLGTCGTVYYILYKYKYERKKSISQHIAINKYSHGLYAFGHFVGGLCFLIFAYKFFYVMYDSLVLLLLACAGFIAEQIQSFFPQNVRFEKIHTIGAALMGISMVLVVALAPSIVHLASAWLVAYMCLVLVYVLTGVYAYFNKAKFYQAQLVFFSVFYLFLLVLLYGGIN